MSGIVKGIRAEVPTDWDVHKLSDIAAISSGTTPSRSEQARYFDDGTTPWVKTGDLNNGLIAETEEYLRDQAISECSVRVYPRDTVIVAMYGGFGQIGRTGRLIQPSSVNQALSAIQLRNGDVDAAYLQAWLNGRVKLWRRFAASSRKDPNITGSDVAAFPVAFPLLSEQARIAAVLLTWDRAIVFTQQITAAKRCRKDALLQQFVCRSGDNWPSIKLGELFKNRIAKGKAGLPTYSVTMNAGLVPRESLDRKNDTTLEPEQHLLIERGDIAYNMMRMWQGASGLATDSGLVSPAYVVIRSRGKVDPLFASYWFKMPRVVKKFQDYSRGLTKDRLRLYYKDFASISLPLPPLKLQQQIAKVMQCCDRELDALERKLELLKRQKKGLMQQLLTGKTRVKLPKGIA